MNTDTAVPVPKLFMPHPNLSDEVNRNIVQSELLEGGVYLDNLSDGEVLEVETQNRWYIRCWLPQQDVKLAGCDVVRVGDDRLMA